MIASVGRPISVVQNDEPSVDYINEIHAQYVDGLVAVFEENKLKFGLTQDDVLTIN